MAVFRSNGFQVLEFDLWLGTPRDPRKFEKSQYGLDRLDAEFQEMKGPDTRKVVSVERDAKEETVSKGEGRSAAQICMIR